MKTIKLGTAARQRIEELRIRNADPEKFRPVATPIPELDDIIKGGFPRTAFYIAIVGEDKMGKTTVGFQLFFNYCEATGEKGILYNLEENSDEASDRAMTMRSSTVNRNHIFRLELTDSDFEKLNLYASEIDETEVFVNDEVYRLAQIFEDAEAQGATVVCIDNFQLLTDGVGHDQREKLEYLSKMIMRKRNGGMKIFLLSQGNASGKTFGSTQVFRDANLVILIEHTFDDDDKKRKNPLEHLRTLKVTRSRWSGTGSCMVLFEPQYSRIRSATLPEIDVDSNEFMSFEQLTFSDDGE